MELTADEIRRLTDLPDAAFEVKPTLQCELEEGHAGPHCGLAQSDDRGFDDQTNYWLKWSAESREWAQGPACSAEDDETAYSCLLVAGHEGGHDFSPAGEADSE